MRRVPRLLAGAALLILGGCATPPEVYRPTDPYYRLRQVEFPGETPRLERAEFHPLVDGLNHYLLSLPTKLLLLNWRVMDHELPERNVQLLQHYLDLNGLTAVKIRHNRYDPIDELRRLTQNSDVGWGYRYTLGLVSWLQYTIFPGRLFGGLPLIGVGDHFNPFSNTVHVYSSDLGILLHELGHAKDYVEHDSRGTSFVLMRLVPGIDLMQEARATGDAIRYLRCVSEPGAEIRAYRTLIPAYSTYIAGYFEGGLVVTLPLVAVGHVSGRAQAARRSRAIEMTAEFPSGRHPDDYLPGFCGPVLPIPGLSPGPDP